MYFSDLTRNKPLTPATEIFNEEEIETMGAINKEPVINIEQAEKAINLIAGFKPSKAQKHLGYKKLAKSLNDLKLVSFGFHINNTS